MDLQTSVSCSCVDSWACAPHRYGDRECVAFMNHITIQGASYCQALKSPRRVS
jgi:hypothetical protein